MELSQQELKEHWWNSRGILEQYNDSIIELCPEESDFSWSINYLYLTHSKFRVSGAVIFNSPKNAILLAQELIDYVLSNFDQIELKDNFFVGRKSQSETLKLLNNSSNKDFRYYIDYQIYHLTRKIEFCDNFIFTNNELNQDGICDIDIIVNYNLLVIFDTPPEARLFGWHDAELLPEHDGGFNTILDALEAAYQEGSL